MKYRKPFVFAIVVAGVFSARAERVDAINGISNAWQPRSWASAHAWDVYAPPGGGGIATFGMDGSPSDRGVSENYYNQNISGLELSGLDFLKTYANRIYGQDIKFVGPCPWISTARTSPTAYAKTSIVMKGEGTNPLLKKGVGRLTLEKSPKDFTSFDILCGTLVITNGVDNTDTLCANGVPVNVKYGTLSYEPPKAGDTTKLATLNNGEGYGKVSVSNGTLTAESFTKTTGGIMSVKTYTGGKFLVKDKESVTAPDGGMISLSGRAISFLDYDATEGWKAGTGLPANAKVFGEPTDAADTIIETGDISFETNEGYVWRPAIDANTTLRVTGTMTVPTDGITFASVASANGTRPTINFSQYNSQLDGKLRFCGTSMSSAGITSDKIASTAEISVSGCDSASPAWGGVLNFSVSTLKNNNKFNCTFRLAGGGDRLALVVSGAGWQYKLFEQSGSTFLEDDVMVGSSDKALLRFSGPVTGRGGLTVNGSVVELTNGNNTFGGAIKVAAATVLTVSGDGTLGSGDINLAASDSRLAFCNLSKYQTITNYFVGKSGILILQKANLALTHPARVATTYVQNGSKLALGGDLRTNHIYLDQDATLTSTNSDVTLTTANLGYSVLAGQLADGTDGTKLSLVKEGANQLVLCGTNNAYTGGTTVKGGTLKLGGSLFNESDVSFWIDPSDESTVTVSDGKVTRINSKIGDVYFTGSTTDTSYPAPTYVTDSQDFNGKKFMSFMADGTSGAEGGFKKSSRLTPNASTENRTLFIVFKTDSDYNYDNGSVVGYGTGDVSLRIGSGGNLVLGRTAQQDYWPTASFGRFDGKTINSGNSGMTKSADGSAHIAGLFVPSHYLGAGGYNHYSNFKAYIGCNADRSWAGNIGEVISFKRVLTKPEYLAVENYLMKKWHPGLFTEHSAEACQLPTTACLPANGALSIATGAIVDLNGADQTVASLSGDGVITNSASTPARLTVSGTDTFRGRVTGNVTYVTPSGSHEVVLRNGATMVLSGTGDTTIKASNLEPPLHDLAFWLDAAWPDLPSYTNETGQLLRWYCRSNDLCAVKCFRNIADTAYRPVFKPTGWNSGKPSVYFSSANCKIASSDASGNNKAVDLMTLFLVMKSVKCSNKYVFGPEGVDRGIHVVTWTSGDGYSVQVRGPTYFNSSRDLVRINGADKSLTTDVAFDYAGDVLSYVMRADGAHAASDHLKNRTWTLGSYSGSRGCMMHVAEVIGYSVRLSESEILATEKYLRDKWINSGTEWPEQETQALDSSCGLGVGSGATLDVGAEDVTLKSVTSQGGTIRTSGALTVSDSFVFQVANGTIQKLTIDGNLVIGSQAVATFVNGDGLSRAAARHDALEVTGTVSGGELSTAEGLPAKWLWKRIGKFWAACRRGMLILVR